MEKQTDDGPSSADLTNAAEDEWAREREQDAQISSWLP